MARSGATFVGVDIGGTKVAAGLVDAHGKILTRARTPMSARGTAAEGLAAVQTAINAAVQDRHLEEAEGEPTTGRRRGRNRGPRPAQQAGVGSPRLKQAVPAAIGISSPGPLDPRRGIVLNPPNLPCWRNFPLARAVEKSHRLPTRVDNDANAAALAEARWGAGRGYAAVLYATLGTGIGTGLILDGKIYHGRTGAAVEGGHISLDARGARCGCGQRGCIEALAAGPAVARRAQAAVRRDPKAGAALLRLAQGNRAAIRAETVAAAWRAGDPLATTILEESAALLARWLGAMVTVLEPEVIIFGGGMGRLMAHWFPQIRRQLPAWSINARAGEIPLRRARYGAEAGIAGAAALCVGA
ncbi:MAG TPA: ROK family protein [Terriglobales bacterium]|nr:ROK family protein [Terriglobales bacterium]